MKKSGLDKVILNALEAWKNIDRVEVAMRGFDNNIEGIGSLVSNVVQDVKNCKTNIEEINITLFLRDDDLPKE
ncbi:MAG: hypothetical protein AAFZ15_30765 [Bacteroidota bacterium]